MNQWERLACEVVHKALRLEPSLAEAKRQREELVADDEVFLTRLPTKGRRWGDDLARRQGLGLESAGLRPGQFIKLLGFRGGKRPVPDRYFVHQAHQTIRAPPDRNPRGCRR